MAKNYSIPEMRGKALNGDVSWDMNRLYCKEIRSGDPEVMAILGLGHAIATKQWIESTTNEAMQYGADTKEKRFEHAINHADAAGVPLVTIAETFNLSFLLPPELLADMSKE